MSSIWCNRQFFIIVRHSYPHRSCFGLINKRLSTISKSKLGKSAKLINEETSSKAQFLILDGSNLSLDITQADLGAVRRRKGIDFEKQAMIALGNYGFDLTRTSKQNQVNADEGIDLNGSWTFAEGFKVVAQCKSLIRSVSVATIRELESSMKKISNESEEEDKILGLLATVTDLSPAAKRWFEQSLLPICIATVREETMGCSFAMNAKMSHKLPRLRVVRQFDRVYGSFVDVLIRV